jgi:hypothetical protein
MRAIAFLVLASIAFAQQSPRRLSDTQKQALLDVVRPFKGQRISIVCILGDIEGRTLARDLVEVLRKAEWTGIEAGSGITQAEYDKNPKGAVLSVSHEDATAGKVPPAAQPLMQALKQFGLLTGAGNSDKVPAASLELRIGRNP